MSQTEASGRWLRRYFQQRRARREQARQNANRLDAAIERMVDASNPRIRSIAGYRKILRPIAEQAISHCTEVAARIPGPVVMDSVAWSRNPTIHAMFGTAQSLRETLSRSPAVRTFFRTHPQLEECRALLSLRLEKREVLGIELHGNTPRREVAQTQAVFSRREVTMPTAVEQELRSQLEERLLVQSVEEAARQLAHRQRKINRLEQERQALNSKLRLQDKPARADVGPGTALNAQRQQLERLEQEIEAARHGLTDYRDYLSRLAELLSDPQAWPVLEAEKLRVDRMNIVRDQDRDPNSLELDYSRLVVGSQPGQVLMIIRFPGSELLPEDHFLEQAERLWGA